ncbi:2597_t:CDS:1, partial [Funneliformis caledonium]
MSDKAEVLNKTNTSDISTIDKLDKDKDNTPNRLTSDEKIFSNQVATLANEMVKFIEAPDGTKLKIFSNSSQAWYTGDINPVTDMRL